jgi:hypothetical protein
MDASIPSRSVSNWRTGMKRGALVAIGTLALSACNPDFVTRDESQVILRITNIEAEAGGGGAGSGVGTVLNSDVSTGGSIFNDNATLTVDTIVKNRNLTDAGPLNDVILQRYEVTYFRSDGRNTPGVDVPVAISGPLDAIVHSQDETNTDVAIVIVRHQAKVEPPLRNLTSGGGAFVLTCIAEITIHGTTTNGKGVTATGRLQINFADFAD